MKRQGGFTLLEMVVAIAVFSIMGLMAYRGLTGILDAREALERESAALTRLSFAFSLLERDLRQALPRPVRDELGDPQPALFGDARTLALTRLGWANPARLPRASLERVEYGWEGGTLRRLGWPVLDRGPRTRPAVQELLDGVDSVRLRFLRDRDQWLDEWPPPGGDDPDDWPRAVRVLIEGPAFGTVARSFALVAPAAPVEVPGPFVVEPDDG